MVKKDIWDILFWIILLFLVFYIIAKLSGIINTPEWINLLPLIGIVFAAGILYQKLIHFVGISNRRMAYIKNSLDDIVSKNIETDKRILSLEKGQEMLVGFLKKEKK